jgi:hypothetical protein
LQGLQKYDAYKVDLALLEYLGDLDLDSGDTSNQKVLILELGRGKKMCAKQADILWAKQADIRRISTELLYGVDV